MHLAETLAEEEPALAVSARSVRRVLAEPGLAPPRSRRPARHRSRRERMPRAGMLLQADASRHDWLEGRGPLLTLVGGIDDATSGFTGAVSREQEDAAGYFLMLHQTIRRVGLPLALYTDRHGIFVKGSDRPSTLREQLTGQRSLTQVGRALEQVGVRWIGARSPQAKGRIERGWGTAQDRLVSELRHARAETLEQANVVLARYLPRHNARFAVPAADGLSAWRPWTLSWPVEAELCFHYPRPGGARCHAGLGRSRPGAAPADRWASLGPPCGDRRGASRRQPLGARRRRAPSPPRGTALCPLLRARRLSRLDALASPSEPSHPTPTASLSSAASASSPWRPAADHPWRR